MKKSLRLKIVIGLALLTLTTSAFADAKSDYDQAMQYAKENKVDDAVKALENLSTSKDKQYAVKANYELGMFYLSKKDLSIVFFFQVCINKYFLIDLHSSSVIV